MKRKYFIIHSLVMAGLLLFSACNDGEENGSNGGDVEITDELPTGSYDVAVSNINVTNDVHQLSVTWDAPSDVSDLGHYVVTWQGTGTDNTLYSQAVTETSFVIDGLYNEPYNISVYAVSKDMLKSSPVSASSTYAPITDNTAPSDVSDLEIESLGVSAAMKWTNPDDDDFAYTQVKVRKVGETDWLLDQKYQSITTNVNITGLDTATNYEYIVSTVDYIGNENASASMQGTFKTKREIALDKFDGAGNPAWSIVAVSSEETAGEGTNGRAEQILDNKDETYWHSVWYSGNFDTGVSSGVLPQYVIIDLHQEVIPSVVFLFRRNGNNNAGFKSVKLESTLETPGKNTEWNDLGVTTCDPTRNDGVPVNAQKAIKARYLKVTIMQCTGNYAMVRSIAVNVLSD